MNRKFWPKSKFNACLQDFRVGAAIRPTDGCEVCQVGQQEEALQ